MHAGGWVPGNQSLFLMPLFFGTFPVCSSAALLSQSWLRTVLCWCLLAFRDGFQQRSKLKRFQTRLQAQGDAVKCHCP